jgi:RNA polymerase sigma-70 factor (ECF subfamily)
LSDLELDQREMTGARRGPAQDRTFDEFYAAHFQRLTLQLWAYTGDLPQAQDVVQEAFCRALARWKRLVAYDDPAAWVRRVALNLATNRSRQLRMFRMFASRQRETHVREPEPDRVMLVQALAGLPDNQRRVLVLHHLADLSVAQIAAQDGVSENTVKSWLRRGRAALADKLTGSGLAE